MISINNLAVIQLAASLLEYPGWKSFFVIHVNIYTAPVILSLVACLMGYVCFHFSFNGKLATPEPPPSNTSSISDKFRSEARIPQQTSKIFPSESGIPRKASKIFPSDLDIAENESESYDKVAFGVLVIAKIGTGLIMITFTSITTLYAMNVFAWTSQELVIFQSSLMVANGVVSTIIALGYVFFKIDRRLCWRFGWV